MAMAAAFPGVDEKALVLEQIAQVALPVGVKFLRLEPYQEWSGEEAWRVFLSVSKRIPLTPRRVRELVKAEDAILQAVLSLRLSKWPYFTLVNAK